MRAANGQGLGNGEELALPMGGLVFGPPRISGYEDFSANSPGRVDFALNIENNLKHEEPRTSRMITSRILGLEIR